MSTVRNTTSVNHRADLIFFIARRACVMGLVRKSERFQLYLDLCSIANLLDLDELIEFGDIDFTHDIEGIRRHVNSDYYPGRLEGDWWPRCQKIGAPS